jgi:HNH endonuclease
MNANENKCIFCDCPLAPGSEEHIFLSAIGGRIVTDKAICLDCNNSFAEGDKVDDSLSESFIIPRCGLMIWSGRNNPPPTIKNAGKLDNGMDYDLAPGFVPLAQQVKVPPKGTISVPQTLSMPNIEAVRYLFKIFRLRGESIKIESAKRVQMQAPAAHMNMSFDSPKALRSISKTALTAACVLFGNQIVRDKADITLRSATRRGDPSIYHFAGWDFVNPWPSQVTLLPHKSVATVVLSGFDHSVYICDVQNNWVAYVVLFGSYRFTVRLGDASGLPPKGIAVDPRRGKDSRMSVKASPPNEYARKSDTSFKDEHSSILDGFRSAMDKVMSVATIESKQAYFETLFNELAQSTVDSSDEKDLNQAIRIWSEKVATISLGEHWEESLDPIEISEV